MNEWLIEITACTDETPETFGLRRCGFSMDHRYSLHGSDNRCINGHCQRKLHSLCWRRSCRQSGHVVDISAYLPVSGDIDGVLLLKNCLLAKSQGNSHICTTEIAS